MIQKELYVTYKEGENLQDLALEQQNLSKIAINETKYSYAPYSQFYVGAAVLLENGEIISANNQENAAFPSGLCAERVAIFYANAKYPQVNIKSIAIAASYNDVLTPLPTYPCGACRQVIAEYAKNSGKDIEIITIGSEKVQVFKGIESLLPFTFSELPK